MGEILEIIEPRFPDLKIPLNLPLFLEAVAKDDKETDVSEQISWTSNKDGLLGKGRRLCPYLTPGNHIITANITINKKTLSRETSFIIIHEDKPPITIRSLLELCWGLSINFSHDENQREFGSNARKKILEIFADYQTIKFDTNSKMTYYPTPNTKKFFDNVTLSLVKTMRNIGFTRNNHQNFLDWEDSEYSNTKKYYDELASFTSLKDSGFAPKIMSFLGGGSLLSLLSDFGSKFFPKPNTDVINSINTTIQSEISNTTTANQASAELTTLVESIPALPVTGILFFIIFGVISLAGFNLFFMWYKKNKLKNERFNNSIKQKEYYVNTYRKDMQLIIFDFYTDLIHLARQFFQRNYSENFDDIDKIKIDEEEFNLLYANNTLSNHWTERETQTSQGKSMKIFYLDVSKVENKDDKVNYFINYKILPNWFTPMNPDKNGGSVDAEKKS